MHALHAKAHHESTIICATTGHPECTSIASASWASMSSGVPSASTCSAGLSSSFCFSNGGSSSGTFSSGGAETFSSSFELSDAVAPWSRMALQQSDQCGISARRYRKPKVCTPGLKQQMLGLVSRPHSITVIKPRPQLLPVVGHCQMYL